MRKFVLLTLMLISQLSYANCSAVDCARMASDASTATPTTTAAPTTTATPTSTNDLLRLLSIFSVDHNLLYVPQVGIPNSAGQFDMVGIGLQLVGVNPLRFQLAAAEAVSAPVQGLSGVYSPEYQMLFLPVVVVSLGAEAVPVYEVVLKLSSLDPLVFSEYAPVQPTQPATPQQSVTQTDPSVYSMMSNMSSMMHNTNMSIIANMDGSCWGTESTCR